MTASDSNGDIELDRGLRDEIDAMHARLDGADHYELLGLRRDADRKAVKRAYYELAAAFHPDRFFRKNLGTYRAKLEAIFSRLTEASDVLGNRAARIAYDATLGPERFRPPSIAPAESSFSAPGSGAPAPLPSAGDAGVNESAPSTPPLPRGADSQPAPAPMTEQARRELLARKLLAGRSLIPPAPRSSPSSMSATTVRSSVPSQPPLRATSPPSRPAGVPASMPAPLIDPRARLLQAERALEEARRAVAAKSGEDADRALREGLHALPDDPTVSRALRGELLALTGGIAELLADQAALADREGKPAIAAKLFARAADLAPSSARFADRAAATILRAKGNLHDAASFAHRAISLEPGHAAFHATLAAVYLAAGLPKSARRELEAGERLAPGDATLRSLRKRLNPA